MSSCHHVRGAGVAQASSPAAEGWLVAGPHLHSAVFCLLCSRRPRSKDKAMCALRPANTACGCLVRRAQVGLALRVHSAVPSVPLGAEDAARHARRSVEAAEPGSRKRPSPSTRFEGQLEP